MMGATAPLALPQCYPRSVWAQMAKINLSGDESNLRGLILSSIDYGGELDAVLFEGGGVSSKIHGIEKNLTINYQACHRDAGAYF